MQRYLMLAVVVTIGVGLDQWTKWWADANLGTGEHPLPIRIAAGEAGQTIEQVLVSRFGLDQAGLDEIAEQGPGGLTILYERADLAPEARAFPEGHEGPRLVHYWAFHHRTLDMPPRRLPPLHKQDEHLAEHGEATLGEYLPIALPYLSAAAVDEVLRDYTFPVLYRPVRLTRPVEEGEMYLLMYRPVSIIDGFTQLKYAENPGAAWGLLADLPDEVRKWFFLVVSILAIGVISMLFHSLAPDQTMPAFAFAVILSGAVGNFIDRLRFGYVIDFIDMYVGEAHWPTYNVADVAISVGVGLLLLDAVLRRERSFLAGRRGEPAPSPTPERAGS